jgi:hypothetical protein
VNLVADQSGVFHPQHPSVGEDREVGVCERGDQKSRGKHEKSDEDLHYVDSTVLQPFSLVVEVTPT